jgi:hypothetical protein
MVSSDCNPTEQQARQGHLDALYLADGRDNPDHPMHALYTGLAQAADGPAVPGGREPASVTGHFASAQQEVEQ